MPSAPPRPLPHYHQFRPIFIAVVSVVWFILYWSFGALVATQLSGEGPLSVWTAWRFFLVGFLAGLFFGAPATLIGVLQQHLAGAFAPPTFDGPPAPPFLWKPQRANNPWVLGINRLFFFWLPAVLVALAVLWFFFPEGVERSTVPLVLAGVGAALAGVVAATSSHAPFFHEIHVSAEQRRWHGSFLSYLFWRHGLPWGVGNGLINAVIALAVFPRTPEGGYGVMPALAVGVDTLCTALILCFLMAVSAHPHAWVDSKLGVIQAPHDAHSPARFGRVAWFVSAGLGLTLLMLAVLKITGMAEISFSVFVLWKGLASTLIAGLAAMVTAYWTLAREKTTVAGYVGAGGTASRNAEQTTGPAS
jgi:hypothetical protein